MKVCTVCKSEKSLDKFYNLKASKDGKSWRCKTCDHSATMESRKKRYFKNREQRRWVNIRYKYGLTKVEYEKLWADCGGVCFICREKMTNDWGRKHHKRKVCVDHCHSTKKVRGLICTTCNKGLGLMQDNEQNLKRAIRYLQNAEVH